MSLVSFTVLVIIALVSATTNAAGANTIDKRIAKLEEKMLAVTEQETKVGNVTEQFSVLAGLAGIEGATLASGTAEIIAAAIADDVAEKSEICHVTD